MEVTEPRSYVLFSVGVNVADTRPPVVPPVTYGRPLMVVTSLKTGTEAEFVVKVEVVRVLKVEIAGPLVPPPPLLM